MFKSNNKKACPKPSRRVIVAISGGVDSSVAAALLKNQGFNVAGVFMKFWSPMGSAKENRCCTLESEKRAKLIAKKLDIPFYVFNFEKEFKRKVVDYFLKEHKTGVTPNPCVVCNKEIKFGLLLEKALKLGTDYVATGHYATTRKVKNKKEEIIYKLLKGRDKQKDQSYFLWELNQRQLKHVLFPVGGYTKFQVRKLAEEFNLPTAKTKESQEVCFINTKIRDFLGKYLKTKPGNIVDAKGKILGSHQGLWFYTIGQRKGIGVASKTPYYVLRKDVKSNELVITQKENDLLQKELKLGDINWISGEAPKLPLKVQVKIRYRSQSVPAIVFTRRSLGGGGRQKSSKSYIVRFEKPQRAITPGQSVVFYKNEELLGGGIIV